MDWIDHYGVVHLNYTVRWLVDATFERLDSDAQAEEIEDVQDMLQRRGLMRWKRLRRVGAGLVVLIAMGWLGGCHATKAKSIAVIPRTTGNMLWESEHGGAVAAARKVGARIYWNAPTREDDVSAQIALVERTIHGHFQGLILAPDQVFGLMTPVRRAIVHGLFTVIVGSPMTIPAGDRLAYVLNDDEEGGRIAARRVASLLHGEGSVAIIGINPDIAGVMIRERSFEAFLGANYPGVHIVEKRMGSFNVPHEQQVSEELLKTNHKIDVIVALMWASARGAVATIESTTARGSIRVIGFDPEGMGFDAPSLDSAIVPNTREMGYRAVQEISAGLDGRGMTPLTKLKPLLVSRENFNTEEVRGLTSTDWGPIPLQSDMGTAP